MVEGRQVLMEEPLLEDDLPTSSEGHTNFLLLMVNGGVLSNLVIKFGPNHWTWTRVKLDIKKCLQLISLNLTCFAL